MDTKKKRRVVITGLGTVNPTGNTVAESWANIKAGRCAVGPITAFDTADFKVKLAAEVKDFDPAARIDKREARKMARFTQFAVAAADEAVRDSGLALEEIDHTRFGVILSSGIGGLPTIEEEHTRGQQRGFEKVSPYFVPMSIGNMAAGQIAIRFGLQGMCSCPTTACAGGTNAIGDAFHRIRDGYEDRMLCGGSESCINPLGVGGFTSMKALCTADDPARASIPFDARRSGFVMGEGSGVLLLEELEAAKARGAKIYAEVVGYGANCDAYHFTAPAPDGAGGVEGVFTALALHDAFLPATVNLQEPDPELDLDYTPGQWARGVKCVTRTEPFFAGHFPGHPAMPGVLILEALAQTGAVAALSLPENRGKLALFGGVKNARFRRQVIPGDMLILECELIEQHGPVSIGKATAWVDGVRAANAELTFVLTDA